jgi:hypothetical protein
MNETMLHLKNADGEVVGTVTVTQFGDSEDADAITSAVIDGATDALAADQYEEWGRE